MLFLPPAGENQRSLAVYMLTLDPKTPSTAFETIAMMPNPLSQQELDPHSAEVYSATFTKALQVQATMELKKRAQ